MAYIEHFVYSVIAIMQLWRYVDYVRHKKDILVFHAFIRGHSLSGYAVIEGLLYHKSLLKHTPLRLTILWLRDFFLAKSVEFHKKIEKWIHHKKLLSFVF